MNTTIIIILISCATVIALVAIICDHLYEKKSVEMDASNKIIKVHRNYIIGFLGFAVIMLLTAKYGGQNNDINDIYEYLSFGSTITSLVLSILAIFVTVRSSSDLYKQFGTINKLSNQIDGTLENLKEAEAKLEKTSSNISNQVDIIVNEIDKRLDIRMQQTDESIRILTQALTHTNNTSQETDAPNNITYFLNNLPYMGLLTMYACAKGYENRIYINITKLFKVNKNGIANFAIAISIIATTISAGYIKGTFKYSKDEEKNLLLECTNATFSSTSVRDAINKNKSISQEKADDDLNKIDEYFESEKE